VSPGTTTGSTLPKSALCAEGNHVDMSVAALCGVAVLRNGRCVSSKEPFRNPLL
jgi:hypothetical protein